MAARAPWPRPCPAWPASWVSNSSAGNRRADILIESDGGVSGVSWMTASSFALAGVVSNVTPCERIANCWLALARPTGSKKRRGYEPACSGVVLYLGLDRRYEQLLHHNFVFSRDPHEEFDFIYRQGEPAPDPTCYLCAPAATEPEVAPPGGEALYVLVHTPYLPAAS